MFVNRDLMEKIAIIGMAGRFPGANTIDGFWQNLCKGKDSITWFTDEELRSSGVPDEVVRNPAYVKAAPVLSDIDRFDASFFQISPYEASLMDPHQRLFLECAWEALEDAGCDPNQYSRAIGLFAGQGSNFASYAHAYNSVFAEFLGQNGSIAHLANDKDYLSTRTSFKLNLRGPSVTVQTACSSSLVATHLACQSILAGDCDVALAGGVSVRVPHRVGHLFEEGNVRSANGQCRVFDADATGTMFGSGAGVVVLKRCRDAIADGDRIYAIIRGSAINNDGSDKFSYTASSVPQQARVIADALSAAGVSPESINYVEAHGTATVVGDPLEIQALHRVFVPRTRPGSCVVGSVKANVGHLEAAAGVTGLIKLALMLYHGMQPPSINYSKLNPRIKIKDSPFRIQTDLTDWVGTETPRRGCVNSLGIGGTNAHVVMEEVTQPARVTDLADAPTNQFLLLSAKCHAALRESGERYGAWFEQHPRASLGDVCYTAAAGRSHFEHRAAVLGRSAEEMREGLAALAKGMAHGSVVSGTLDRASERPKLAWLFTGQGSQYPHMAKTLYVGQPVFRAVLDECATLWSQTPLAGTQGLLDILLAENDEAAARVHQTEYTQPCLFALEVGLARLYQSWGMQPDVVVGHSVGQYAAACVAGIFSLSQGFTLIAERGRLMGALPAGGQMAAVFVPAGQVDQAVSAHSRVSVAAYNGNHTVISGPEDAVREVLQRFDRENIRTHVLATSHAFHSALLDPALDAFEAAANQVEYQPAEIPLICNLDGQPLPTGVLNGAYWRRHARQPVQFSQSIATLAEMGCEVLLELGPHPILTPMAAACWNGPTPFVGIPTLQRQSPADESISRSIAQLHVRGVPIDFDAFYQHENPRKISLPTYPFQRKKYWVDPNHTDIDRFKAVDRPPASKRNQSLYRIEWETSDQQYHVSSAEGSWLVLCDRNGVGERLCKNLRESGHPTDSLNPDEDLDAGLERVKGRHKDIAGIVCLWALDFDFDDSREAFDASRLQRFVLLIKLLRQKEFVAPVYFLTKQAQAEDTRAAVNPIQSAVWALAKAIAVEHPQMFGRLIDLPRDVDHRIETLLANELASSNRESEVLLRDKRHVARLRAVAPTSESVPNLPPGGTYLITGGLGTLGLKTARWLAEQGAQHIVLASRRSLDFDTQRIVEEIQSSLPCAIHMKSVDVAEYSQVQSLIAEIQSDLSLLRGVIHSAGTVKDALIENQTDSHFRDVFDGKARGAWNLHLLTRNISLDFFVVYSSAISVFGNVGQTNYAAANGFLDGLVSHRRFSGLTSHGINWGPWAGVGMAAQGRLRDYWSQLGIVPISDTLGRPVRVANEIRDLVGYRFRDLKLDKNSLVSN